MRKGDEKRSQEGKQRKRDAWKIRAFHGIATDVTDVISPDDAIQLQPSPTYSLVPLSTLISLTSAYHPAVTGLAATTYTCRDGYYYLP